MNNRLHSVRQAISCFLISIFSVFALNAQKTFEVKNLSGDASKGSLIEAINKANETLGASAEKPNIIQFAKGLKGEIILSENLPALNNHIAILGNLSEGKPAVKINGSVNPAVNEGLKGGVSPGFRTFVVNTGKTVSIEGLEISASNHTGITNMGNLTVKNCILSKNFGAGSINGTGGGIQNENGNLLVIGCFFDYNTGGVGGTDGGVGYGGAGGINIAGGNVVVAQSSFIDNEGGFGGVGVGSAGGAGAVSVLNGNVSIVNCTIAGNFGGGSIVSGASGGMIVVGGSASLLRSVVCNNMGGAGFGGFGAVEFCSGGIHILKGSFTLGGNILGTNFNGKDVKTDLEKEADGEVRSAGYNLFGTSNAKLEGTGDTVLEDLSKAIVCDKDGKFKAEVKSGFIPVVTAASGISAQKSPVIGKENFIPVKVEDPAYKWFEEKWNSLSVALNQN